MKRFCIIILAILITLFTVQPIGIAAEVELSMTAAARLTYEGYTLGDLAAARLAVYGILDEKMKTPREETKLPLSREDAAAVLYAAFGDEEGSYTSPFRDISDEYAEAVAWAYSCGITNGVSETEFGLGNITQAEFVTMLLRYMGYCFEWENALELAESVGLSPVGLSDDFCLGDAALYIQRLADDYDIQLNIKENFEQIPFPYLVVLTPDSLEEAETQIQMASKYLPTFITVYGDCLSDVYEQYRGYWEMSESQSFETEVWWLGRTAKFSPVYDTDKYEITFYVYWDEVWRLACDADDAFTAFEDDTVTQLADAFYAECIVAAASDDDYDIVMAAKQCILRRASYATPISYEDSTALYSSSAHSVLGFLQNGKIVCDGYSAAFMYVMLRAGIPCVEVIGSTESENGKANHAWNKVKIDGKWYNIDLCWADTERSARYDLKSDAAYSRLSHWDYAFASGAYAAVGNYR